MKASGDRYLSHRELALARPSSRSGRTASSVPVDPSRALGPCVPRGNSRGERPQLAPARSLLRYGNGRAGRNRHARRRVDSATYLHDALSPAQAESSTMRWRKKLYDALTVRRFRRRNQTAQTSGTLEEMPSQGRRRVRRKRRWQSNRRERVGWPYWKRSTSGSSRRFRRAAHTRSYPTGWIRLGPSATIPTVSFAPV